jgi:hypothetical protein
VPSWRLTTNAPAVGKLAAAAIPVPSPWAGAWQSRGVISGNPGMYPIAAPSPLPETGAAGLESARGRSSAAGRVALAQQGPAAGGMYLDDTTTPYWLPSVYYVAGPQEHPPVSVQSDNQMPVPAINPTGQPGIVMPGILMRGQRQVAQPRVSYKSPKFMGQ